MSNEVNPAYSVVSKSVIIVTYEAKEKAIKPLGLRIESHLDGVGSILILMSSLYIR